MRLDEASAAVRAAVDAGVVAGAVAHVRYAGEVVLDDAFGLACISPPRPMATSTVFDLASLTKPLAGAGVALALVDRGCFSLDEEVATWLAEMERFRGHGVTIRRLLSHTAGVTGWRPVYAGANGTAEVVQAIATLGLASPPGSRFEYSDLGFIILGAVIERAAGADLAALADDLLFRPCGLTRTRFRPEGDAEDFAITEEGNAFERRMAEWAGIGFDRWRTTFHPGEVNDGNAHYGLGGVSAHAGLFSTASEVATLGQMWLDEGLHDRRRVLSPAVVGLATSDHAPAGGARRGLGWELNRRSGPTLDELRRADAGFFPPAGSAFVPRSSGELLSAAAFGHTGFTGTSMWIDPDLDVVAVLLTNATHPRVEPGKPLNAVRARFANAVAAGVSSTGSSGRAV